MSTIGAMSIGVLLGAIAGYYRGTTDTVISRVIEVTMAFPALLFIIALASTVGSRLDTVTFGFFAPGVITLVLVFTIFGWFYPARIVRAQVLSLREKEFIEAARMIGASDGRIIRSHLLPHLVAPIIVYSTLVVAGYVLGEAGLSFLNLGIKLPTASWGNLLASAPEYYTIQPLLMVWPGLDGPASPPSPSTCSATASATRSTPARRSSSRFRYAKPLKASASRPLGRIFTQAPRALRKPARSTPETGGGGSR